MRLRELGLATACLVTMMACESSTRPGDSGVSGPPAGYADIAGEYSAPVTATGTGLLLTGTMYLFLAQDGGSFTGSYAVVGILDEGTSSSSVTLLGSVVNGTLTTGSSPDLNLRMNPAGCGAVSVASSGSFSGTTGAITLSPANIPVQDLDCLDILRAVSDTVTLVP